MLQTAVQGPAAALVEGEADVKAAGSLEDRMTTVETQVAALEAEVGQLMSMTGLASSDTMPGPSLVQTGADVAAAPAARTKASSDAGKEALKARVMTAEWTTIETQVA